MPLPSAASAHCLHCTRGALHPLPVRGVHALAIRQRPDRHPPELVQAMKAARLGQRLGEGHRLITCPPLMGAAEVEMVVQHAEGALDRVELIAATASPRVDDFALEIVRRCAVRVAVCRALREIDAARRERSRSNGLRV